MLIVHSMSDGEVAGLNRRGFLGSDLMNAKRIKSTAHDIWWSGAGAVEFQGQRMLLLEQIAWHEGDLGRQRKR
jgi:hypothetical protein